MHTQNGQRRGQSPALVHFRLPEVCESAWPEVALAASLFWSELAAIAASG